jgi:hypothetical protein
MDKKEGLKRVFDFIADYLKEDEEKVEIKKEEKVLLVEEKPTSAITKLKTPIDSLNKDAEHIKSLMNKIDEKTKEEAKTKSLLSIQRKEFQDELKKLKEDAIEKAIEFKLNEEMSLTGVTLSKLNNDFDKVSE